MAVPINYFYCILYAWADQRVQQFYNCHNVSSKYVVIERGWYLYNARVVALLTHLYQRKAFVYSIKVLTKH